MREVATREFNAVHLIANNLEQEVPILLSPQANSDLCVGISAYCTDGPVTVIAFNVIDGHC